MKLAVLLILVVFGAHYAPSYAALAYPDPTAAARAWFYIAQGLKGCFLLTVIAVLVPRKVSSIPLWLACAWGAFEDEQVVVCRLARGIESVPTAPLWGGICGGSWFFYSLISALIAASAVAYGVRRDATA